ncbi:hypothetical protein K3555_21180 (plasmid) [Leisingera sp. M527]|uniref:type II secretion system protein N n=1 Tax=Leisingera sp. M527 TaxID=2867014 RepID=UPI0021A3F334|nr:type II secretion system protein N [Leisingera sp. M527]UWQ35175.1 hypothetical protein K3555_21180 [Leisingera sp. M527]
MRLISAFCTLIALAAAAQAGQLLWQEVRAPSSLPARALAAAPAAVQQPAAAPAPPRSWAPLFGEKQPPQPQAPASAPAASATEPPLASLGYALQGVVQAGEATWAMISHPAGARLLRAGDELPGGVKVVRIDSRGLWLSRRDGVPELLNFPQ